MRIIAFGGGAVGQLGITSSTPSPSSSSFITQDSCASPVYVEGNAWKTVQCGNFHTVALTTHGLLHVWGAGWNGQLGLGKAVQKQLLPRALSLEENVAVYKISCGASHTVALSVDRRVISWGGSDSGDFGVRNVTGFPNGILLRSVAAGNAFSLALSSDGQVFSWGSGLDGRLGVGSTRDFRNPQKVDIPELEGNSRVIKIAAGKAHSLAVTDSGSVFSWGCGTKGQLGHGDTDNKPSPTLISGISGIVRIAAGENHSLALTNKGKVYSWGGGEQGQLGLGDEITMQTTPALVSELPEEVCTARIAAGQQHSIAVTDHGDVFTWGNNAFGQLGLGHTEGKTIPEFVDTLPDQAFVAKAEAGERHTILLITDYNRFDPNNAEKHRLSMQPPVPKIQIPRTPTSSGGAVLNESGGVGVGGGGGASGRKRGSSLLKRKTLDDAFAEMENDFLAMEDDTGGDDGGQNNGGDAKVTPRSPNSAKKMRESSDVLINVNESSKIVDAIRPKPNKGCWCTIL